VKKEKVLTGEGGEALRGAALAPWATTTDGLGLFLLPKGRPGQRFIDADDEAIREASFGLFLLPWGRPWWCGVDVGILYVTGQLETPREGYDEHISKSSLSCETKVYRTSRRKNQTSKG
jgi:hypothetical protein